MLPVVLVRVAAAAVWVVVAGCVVFVVERRAAAAVVRLAAVAVWLAAVAARLAVVERLAVAGAKLLAGPAGARAGGERLAEPLLAVPRLAA